MVCNHEAGRLLSHGDRSVLVWSTNQPWTACLVSRADVIEIDSTIPRLLAVRPQHVGAAVRFPKSCDTLARPFLIQKPNLFLHPTFHVSCLTRSSLLRLPLALLCSIELCIFDLPCFTFLHSSIVHSFTITVFTTAGWLVHSHSLDFIIPSLIARLSLIPPSRYSRPRSQLHSGLHRLHNHDHSEGIHPGRSKRITAMAGGRDPEFWKRFSVAVHLDEERAQANISRTTTEKSDITSRPKQLHHS